MSKSGFEWVVGHDPPPLKPHSAAKLKVIRDYLNRYLDTVAPDPRQDKLSLSLVDGFSGGGAFLYEGNCVPGSPIVMMKAIEEAEERINKTRKKQFRIEATYYLIDKNPAAIAFLRSEIEKRGYAHKLGSSIHLIESPFENAVGDVIDHIKSRTTAGRSLFLLDQCGWSQVAFRTIRKILDQLRRSEVILTFAVDWLIDHLNANANFLTAVAPLEITEQQIRRFIEDKGEAGGRYLIQRLLLAHLKAVVQPQYYTPFFIRSVDAGKNLWLIHLSKHPTARNVMVTTHWAVQNRSTHQGPGGLNMLGFDPGWEDTLPLDFLFDGNADAMVVHELLGQLPLAIAEAPPNNPMSFEALLAMHANTTTAKVDQIERVLMELMEAKEIEILTGSGRSKILGAKLNPGDRLQLPSQGIFPFLRQKN